MNLKKNLNSIHLVAEIVFSVVLFSCGQHDGHKNHDSSEQESNENQVDSSIIREGEIDLVAIDENGDGMVFQDPMDWNVISDVPGKCPLCKMNLKEVTLEIAKENLINHNFKVMGM